MATLFRAIVTTLILLGASLSATAHELWIEATQTGFAVGEPVTATIRVGENMKGGASSFSPSSYEKLAYISGHSLQNVSGRIGDRPAIRIENADEGLLVVGLSSTANKITYREFAKFETFVTTHGQDFAVAAHRAAGNPEADFAESYYRFAKALIRVGDGAGADAALGLPFELTALDNPFTDAGPLRFQLTFLGKPVADHQVDIYHRSFGDDGKAPKSMAQTDSDGIIAISRKPGRYLVNAVRLERPNPKIAENMGVIWQSLWASSTFWIE